MIESSIRLSSGGSRFSVSDTEAFISRKQSWNEQKHQKLEKLKREISKAELDQCTFKPQLSKVSKFMGDQMLNFDDRLELYKGN